MFWSQILSETGYPCVFFSGLQAPAETELAALPTGLPADICSGLLAPRQARSKVHTRRQEQAVAMRVFDLQVTGAW